MNNIIRSVFVLAVVCCLNSPAYASILVDVLKDGYIDDFTKSQSIPPDGVPDRISDTNALLAGRGEFFDEFNAFNVDSRAIMTFDLSAYSGQSLTSAFLTGYGTRVDNKGSLAPVIGNFYLYSGDGAVGLDDFNASADFVGANTFQADPQGFDLAPFQMDVTSSLQSFLNNGHSFAEFRVQSASPTIFINAGETDPAGGFSTDDRWGGPKLALTFEANPVVPEPSTFFLFGAGLAAMRIRKNKRR